MKPSLLVALVFAALAAALRFYKLGEWPFGLDEMPTLRETRVLFDPSLADQASQTFRLPRLAPLSYLVNALTYPLFGSDEFGSRVGPAVIGSLMVGAVYYLAEILFGRRTAFVIALLLLLSPAHVFQSQLNRFYAFAAFFAALATLFGALAARTASVLVALLACGSAALATLSHTLCAVLFPMLWVGIVGTRRLEGGALPRRLTVALALASALYFVAFCVYALPHVTAWNRGARWGYSVGHSILASANLLGWPITLLAGTGIVLMFEERARERWFWLSALGTWAAVTVVLPAIMTYHAWYAFPFAASGLVCAGYALGRFYERARPTHPRVAALAVTAALCLNLPSLVSHFLDGSRLDMRSAASFVNAHFEKGDRVVTDRVSTFRHYAPGLEPVLAFPWRQSGPSTLSEHAGLGGRLWIVIGSTRSGLPPALQSFLLSQTSHKLHLSKARFDYFENTVDVFLFAGRPAPSGGTASAGGPAQTVLASPAPAQNASGSE